ncbi:MAG: trigger factor [Actinomycetota bacterium]|nr:trigger factor [Actinomycetota bacterium]
MKAVVEPLEGNKVKLSIEVDEDEFERALDAAFRKIAKEVRIPGFRPGRAPRRILEARLGAGTGRSEALREALPDYYARALLDNDVDAIAAPEIDITSGQDSGPVVFDAVVEVRPHLRLAGYEGLRVEVPDPGVTEEDIAAQVDRLRGNLAELAVVERPATDGDHLTIDLHAERDGEAIGGMTTDDFVYELGSATVLPELDTQLNGAKVGDIIAFDAELPDGVVALRVLVKEVKEKMLPDVTDGWASEASEFDTVDELRADIVKRLRLVKKMQATMALRDGTVEALVELVEEEPPKALIDAEVERRAHDLGHRLESQGATIAQYLQATGRSEQDVIAEMRSGAEPAVKADLALRAVAEGERLAPTDEEVDAEIARLSGTHQTTPADLRRQLESAGRMPAVRSDLERGKALEWLIEHTEVVDAEGQPVDRALLDPQEPQPSQAAPAESGEA